MYKILLTLKWNITLWMCSLILNYCTCVEDCYISHHPCVKSLLTQAQVERHSNSADDIYSMCYQVVGTTKKAVCMLGDARHAPWSTANSVWFLSSQPLCPTHVCLWLYLSCLGRQLNIRSLIKGLNHSNLKLLSSLPTPAQQLEATFLEPFPRRVPPSAEDTCPCFACTSPKRVIRRGAQGSENSSKPNKSYASTWQT